MAAKCNEIRQYDAAAPLVDCPYLCRHNNPTASLKSYTATGTSTDPSNTRFWQTVNKRLKNNGSNDGEVVIGNKRFVFTRAGIF